MAIPLIAAPLIAAAARTVGTRMLKNAITKNPKTAIAAGLAGAYGIGNAASDWAGDTYNSAANYLKSVTPTSDPIMDKAKADAAAAAYSSSIVHPTTNSQGVGTHATVDTSSDAKKKGTSKAVHSNKAIRPVNVSAYKDIVGKHLAVPATTETTADTITLSNAPAMTAVNAILGNTTQTGAAPVQAAEKEGLGWWARLTQKTPEEQAASDRDMQARVAQILGGDKSTVRRMYGKDYIEDNQ